MVLVTPAIYDSLRTGIYPAAPGNFSRPGGDSPAVLTYQKLMTRAGVVTAAGAIGVPGFAGTAFAHATVVWTANAGAGIKPGQFQQFYVSFDSLPDAGAIEIKALRTYSDSTIMRWIDDPAPAGQDEPDHPAPVLTLVADKGADAPTPATSAAAPAVAAATTSTTSTSGNGATLGIAIAGLVLGLIGAVTGGLAYRRDSAR
jgi:hypothetical protein